MTLCSMTGVCIAKFFHIAPLIKATKLTTINERAVFCYILWNCLQELEWNEICRCSAYIWFAYNLQINRVSTNPQVPASVDFTYRSSARSMIDGTCSLTNHDAAQKRRGLARWGMIIYIKHALTLQTALLPVISYPWCRFFCGPLLR